jgi:Mn2+/Fe2+ NRAMP family transporter
MFQKYERWCISVFILLSTLIFIFIGKPKELLIFAGAVNGFILPLALTVVLIAATKKRLMKNYQHPLWMQICGWIVVALMGTMSCMAVLDLMK